MTNNLTDFIITQKTKKSQSFNKMVYIYSKSIKTTRNGTLELVFQCRNCHPRSTHFYMPFSS